jgi:hypothetical protein
MREMFPFPRDGPITQFRCTDCAWVFHVQKPLTPDVSFEAQRKIAARWFYVHSCFEFPRKASVRYVVRRIQAHTDSFVIERYSGSGEPPEVQRGGWSEVDEYLREQNVPVSDIERVMDQLRKTGYAQVTISVR